MTTAAPSYVDRSTALLGVLLGTAVGDALGLPMEGLSARRQALLFAPPLRHRLVAGRGMVSDDTEHTVMVAQALLEQPHDVAAFQRALARRLRWWLVALPAGVGFATLRAILKLWLGWPPTRSGIHSAGNGPAMRSALLGVYFAEDATQRRAYVRASTQLTHTDPRAEVAAQAVAETVAWMTQQTDDMGDLWDRFEAIGTDAEWAELLTKMREGSAQGQSVRQFAEAIGAGAGISGYAYRTAPAAIYAAVRHRQDFATALSEIIACGGDTDTTAAITGALVGSCVGADGIPKAWRAGLAEWPLSPALLGQIAERLEHQLCDDAHPGPAPHCWPALPLRNLFFLLVVLFHGFRRLLPPY